jgi:hypothetical protein
MIEGVDRMTPIAVYDIGTTEPVMPGQSRPKDGVACARLCPGIHVFLLHEKDVDGRNKSGHDE